MKTGIPTKCMFLPGLRYKYLDIYIFLSFFFFFFWRGGGGVGVKWTNVIYFYMCFPLFFRLQFRRDKHRCYKHKQLKIIVVNKVDYICSFMGA